MLLAGAILCASLLAVACKAESKPAVSAARAGLPAAETRVTVDAKADSSRTASAQGSSEDSYGPNPDRILDPESNAAFDTLSVLPRVGPVAGRYFLVARRGEQLGDDSATAFSNLEPEERCAVWDTYGEIVVRADGHFTERDSTAKYCKGASATYVRSATQDSGQFKCTQSDYSAKDAPQYSCRGSVRIFGPFGVWVTTFDLAGDTVNIHGDCDDRYMYVLRERAPDTQQLALHTPETNADC